MKIAIACDHAALELKEHLKGYLKKLGHQLNDFGTHDAESMDYPDTARPAAECVAAGEADLGIIICGSGIGVSLVANKVKGIRAALCSEPLSARMSRLHNNANVLCMGARMIGMSMAEEIVEEFLGNAFEGGRHSRRVDKIESC